MAAEDSTPPPTEYRTVPGFESYLVGADGSVWHRVQPHCHATGYLRISLYENGNRWDTTVHRLVLSAFVGPRPRGQVARHLNGIRHDNRLLNLAWGTSGENRADTVGATALPSRPATPEVSRIHVHALPAPAEQRDIPEWPGYRVDSEGGVWTNWTKDHTHKAVRAMGWRRLQPQRTKRGYLHVSLYRPGTGVVRQFRVHRLVLLAFVGPCPAGMEGCHLNGIPDDNRIANLAWGTRRHNAADRKTHGRTVRGERQSTAKLTDEAVFQILRRAAEGDTGATLARAFAVSHNTISYILHGKTWTHVAISIYDFS